VYKLDFGTSSELNGLGNTHFDDFAGHCLDLALIESLTRFDRFLLNTRVDEGFECDDNAVSHFMVEAVLVEKCTPQCQRCSVAIG